MNLENVIIAHMINVRTVPLNTKTTSQILFHYVV
jgi:hypothetical protein